MMIIMEPYFSLTNSTDAVKSKQWCLARWSAISLMGAFWASPRWDHPCTCHSHMSVGRTGASRAICHMWAPVGSKWHHRGQMGGPWIIRTAMLDRGCRDADLLCWHPSEGWGQVAGWRHQETRWGGRQGYNNTSVHWAQSTVDNWQFATSPDYDAETPARNISVWVSDKGLCSIFEMFDHVSTYSALLTWVQWPLETSHRINYKLKTKMSPYNNS